MRKPHHLYCILLGQGNSTFEVYKTLSDLLHDISNSIPNSVLLYGYTTQKLQSLSQPHLLRSILGKSFELRTGQEYCIRRLLVQINLSINRNSLPVRKGQIQVAHTFILELLPCKVYCDFQRLIVQVPPWNESRKKHEQLCT